MSWLVEEFKITEPDKVEELFYRVVEEYIYLRWKWDYDKHLLVRELIDKLKPAEMLETLDLESSEITSTNRDYVELTEIFSHEQLLVIMEKFKPMAKEITLALPTSDDE